MKKNIFRLGLLACVGLFMTACSNDDDSLNNKLIPQPTKDVKVKLIGAINSDITRSTIDGGNGKSKWSVGDKIGIRYNSNNGYVWAEGTIESAAEKSTFTATLVGPVSSEDVVLVYPFNCKQEDSPYYSTSSLKAANGQDGTLTKIGSNYNIQSKTGVKMTVDGENASLSATLESRVSIVEFDVLDTDGEKTLDASLLEITVGSATTPTYTIKPASAKNKFYVAMEPTTEAVKVAATITGANGALKLDTEDKVNMMTTTDVGKFICINTSPSDANQAYLCDSKENNNNAKIDVHSYSSTNLVAGNFYTLQLKARNVTFTTRAVVAHVGAINNKDGVAAYCGKFLALAIEDVPTINNDNKVTVALKQNASNTNILGESYVKTFVSSNPMKICGTTYNTLVTGPGESDGSFDEVEENVKNGETNVVTWSHYSNTATSGPNKGWRVPSVTDWRYVFADLCSGPSATDPIGVYDFQNYSNLDLQSIINTKCGTSGTQTIYSYPYWTSSGKKNNSQTINKVWRFNFSGNTFSWNELTDQAYVRLVFAY